MKPNRFHACALGVILLAGVFAAGPLEAGQRSRPPGFVDGSILIDLAGEDALTVEISLHGALLKAITGADPELKNLAGGLESIQAVILDLEETPSSSKIREQVEEIQKELRRQGWQRLARVKEAGAVINVLVLNDEETIQGLVVLVVDESDQQVIFANVAGVLDLAAIERLGEEMDIPGLDDLNYDDGKSDD
jgi:hypothetical protein